MLSFHCVTENEYRITDFMIWVSFNGASREKNISTVFISPVSQKFNLKEQL